MEKAAAHLDLLSGNEPFAHPGSAGGPIDRLFLPFLFHIWRGNPVYPVRKRLRIHTGKFLWRIETRPSPGRLAGSFHGVRRRKIRSYRPDRFLLGVAGKNVLLPFLLLQWGKLCRFLQNYVLFSVNRWNGQTRSNSAYFGIEGSFVSMIKILFICTVAFGRTRMLPLFHVLMSKWLTFMI